MRSLLKGSTIGRLLSLVATFALAPLPAAAQRYTLLDTVGETFDMNGFGGAETALASQLYEVKGGLLGTTTSYQVRYINSSGLLDWWDIAYTWGPLGGGITLKGTIQGLNLSPDTNISWIRAASSKSFNISVAQAVLKPNCVLICTGAGATTVIKNVPFHDPPNVTVIPAPPGAPARVPSTTGQFDVVIEGEPLRLDNYFNLNIDGGLTLDVTPVRFVSEVALRSDSTYRYSYEVRNDSDDLMPYKWLEAGLSGTLDPHTSAARSFVTSLAPLEISAGALFSDAMSTEYAGPTGVFVPVSEPATVTTLLLGLAVLCSRLQRKR